MCIGFDSVFYECVSSLLQRRNSQSRDMDMQRDPSRQQTTSKKGANISSSDVIDIHSVHTSISCSVTFSKVHSPSTGGSPVLSSNAWYTSSVPSGVTFNNSVLTSSSSNTDVFHPMPVHKPSVYVYLVEVVTWKPNDHGLLAAARHIHVPKVAVS